MVININEAREIVAGDMHVRISDLELGAHRLCPSVFPRRNRSQSWFADCLHIAGVVCNEHQGIGTVRLLHFWRRSACQF